MTDNIKKGCPYKNPDCPKCHLPNPTPSQEDWEKEFEQFLTPEGFWNKENNMYPFRVKSFITQLLTTQRAEILEEVEKLRVDESKTLLTSEEFAQNRILEDLLTKLKNK